LSFTFPIVALFLSLRLQSRLHYSTQKTGNVNDQTDPSISQNRRPRYSWDSAQRPAQRLNYRLHAAQQFIHYDSSLELIDLDDHDVFPLWGCTGQAEHAP
jgi:hypothetical protein